jgi:putative FmdB family regulatory protein
MPLYEYRCDACGRTCELLIRGSEKPVCPHCDSPRLAKLLSVVAGPVVKGGGAASSAPPDGGCGRPQCGMGGSAGLD